MRLTGALKQYISIMRFSCRDTNTESCTLWDDVISLTTEELTCSGN